MSEPVPSKTEHDIKFDVALRGLASKVRDTQPPARVRAYLQGASALSGTTSKQPQQIALFYRLAPAGMVLAIVLLVIVMTRITNPHVASHPDDESHALQYRNSNPKPNTTSNAPKAIDARKTDNPIRKSLTRPNPQSEDSSVTVALPYSNSDVSHQPFATIRTSMRTSDLRTLGLDVPDGEAGSEVQALLTLGTDGLPRSITVPIPFKSVQEDR